MDRFNELFPSGGLGDGGNQDAPNPAFWAHHTRMNAGAMADIFKELVGDLPSVVHDTLQEPAAANVIAASASDNGGPGPIVSGSGSNNPDGGDTNHLPGDALASYSNGAMQFARKHPSKF